MQKLETLVKKVRRLGFGRSIEVGATEYYRIEADYWLAHEQCNRVESFPGSTHGSVPRVDEGFARRSSSHFSVLILSKEAGIREAIGSMDARFRTGVEPPP